MWTIIVADVWYSTPFIMVILLGGLQALPVEPFEAAKVDGAGALATLWHVTIPLLRPVLLAAILIRAMDAFQIFDLPFIMTYGGPGARPRRSTPSPTRPRSTTSGWGMPRPCRSSPWWRCCSSACSWPAS